MPHTLHVLTGCTAVGKTALALRWAEVNGAEIVSCDSLLFYRGMDIGTAKPARAELARVPHHLIDIREVTGRMDVTDYVTLARAAVTQILGRGRKVLVTGGSGFYLKAFFAPIADEIAVPSALRAEVRQRLEKEGLNSLVEELRRLTSKNAPPVRWRSHFPGTPDRRSAVSRRARGRARFGLAFGSEPSPCYNSENAILRQMD